MPTFQDITGQRVGRLVATSVYVKASRSPVTATKWHCRCDCGKEIIVLQSSLGSGKAQSCGCLWQERVTKHGNARKTGSGWTGTYRSWANMKQRCNNPKCPDYENWGGRGIKVCKRWLVFENFLADMGPRPDGHSIERIDNDGDYEPANCKWIPRSEEQKNQRRGRKMEAKTDAR